MKRSIIRISGVAAAAAIVFASVPSAFAHEEGTITLSAKQVAPGSELVIRGAKLAKGGSVRLELRGVLATVNFGRVRADTAGAFEQRVTIPADARPGQYTVAAIAADGDVSAQADLVVAAASSATATTAAPAGMADMPGMPGMSGPHASAEAMNVPVTTTPGGWAVIVATIVLAAAAGVALVRGARLQATER